MDKYISKLLTGQYLAISGAFWVEGTERFEFTHALLRTGEVIKL